MKNKKEEAPAKNPTGLLSGEQYAINPRYVREEDFTRLKGSLEKLGDLSGVVHELNSNEYIGGNQRSRVFLDSPFELTKVYDTPTEAGTVAVGWIMYKGERYPYRQVRWSEEQTKEANIAANISAGKWDYDILANEFSDIDLSAINIPEDWQNPEVLPEAKGIPEGNPEEEEEGKKNGVSFTVTVKCTDESEMDSAYQYLIDGGYFAKKEIR